MKYYGDAEITGKATVDNGADVKGKLNVDVIDPKTWTSTSPQGSIEVANGGTFHGNFNFNKTNNSGEWGKVNFNVPATFGNNNLIVKHHTSNLHETHDYNFNVGEKLYYLTEYYRSIISNDIQLCYAPPGSMFLLCNRSALINWTIGKNYYTNLTELPNYNYYRKFLDNTGNIFVIQEENNLFLYSWKIKCAADGNSTTVNVGKIASFTNQDVVSLKDAFTPSKIVIKII